MSLDCEVCQNARRALNALAANVARASIPIPSERRLVDILVENAQRRVEAALDGHEGHDARIARAS